MGQAEFWIAVLAMCLGYSLLKTLITPKSEYRKAGKRRSTYREKGHDKQEYSEDLEQRAQDLLKRVHTLEEILASERSVERKS